MDKIIINGPNRLEGKVKISGAKNAALPILASSILSDGECIYRNIPDLKDVKTILELLKILGAKVVIEKDLVRINAKSLSSFEAPYDLVRKMRASILVLCPLIAKLKAAKISMPGGCAIGARPVDYHVQGLRSLGAEVELNHGYIEAKADKLKGAEIYFDMPSVTGCENLIMAAVLAEGTTILRNAAREPEVIALIDVLNQMGADIQGAGSSVIVVNGVKSLKPVDVTIMPDRIEAGTFMVAAALTKGDILIENIQVPYLKEIIKKLENSGSKIELGSNFLRVKGGKNIKSIDIKTLPYPGFPTDMQAQFMVLMSVADSSSVISETIFENRFIHVSELIRMGADIKLGTANTALVKGVKKLFGAQVMASDLRASASLVLAGICAEGETVINRVYHLDRGYEKIEEKFSALGADIKRVN